RRRRGRRRGPSGRPAARRRCARARRSPRPSRRRRRRAPPPPRRRARPPSARGASNAGPVLTARRAPWESEKGKVKKASYAVFPFLLLTFPFPHERHRHAAGAAAAARELVARQLDGDAGAVLDLVVAVDVEEALGVGGVEAVLAAGVECA